MAFCGKADVNVREFTVVADSQKTHLAQLRSGPFENSRRYKDALVEIGV
jgi:hypothetical protein